MRNRHGCPRMALARCAAGLSSAALLSSLALAAPPSGPRPPERLSFHGDPTAPDMSGVWVLAQAVAVKSGSASEEGWQPWPPPLNGAFAQTYQQRLANTAAGKRIDDPVVGCMPPGMPRFITGDKSPLLIVQTSGRVMFYRDGEGPRRVALDGRALPPPSDTEPFPKGTSIGHYANGGLDVDSVGFKTEPIDSTGVPHSDQLKISERYQRVDAKTLKIQITLTDPQAYTRPMTATVTYTALNDRAWEPREFICTPHTDYHPDRYVH